MVVLGDRLPGRHQGIASCGLETARRWDSTDHTVTWNVGHAHMGWLAVRTGQHQHPQWRVRSCGRMRTGGNRCLGLRIVRCLTGTASPPASGRGSSGCVRCVGWNVARRFIRLCDKVSAMPDESRLGHAETAGGARRCHDRDPSTGDRGVCALMLLRRQPTDGGTPYTAHESATDV